MSAYYNECDPYAAQWLRNLIAAGHIAPGEVDERSIVDVRSTDLVGCTQCHFFAGIGVWSHALRLAGWPDDRPVWTGSCPCQSFSAAGKGEGTGDARHLWPVWFRLIGECRPVVVFGEQVAAAIRHGWLDLVCADLEGLDYTVGAAVMGAHSVGAPHIRQRLYFVADDNEAGRRELGRARLSDDGDASRRDDLDRRCEPRELADATRERERSGVAGGDNGGGVVVAGAKARGDRSDDVSTRSVADADGRNASAERLQRGGEHGLEQEDGGAGGMAYTEFSGERGRRLYRPREGDEAHGIRPSDQSFGGRSAGDVGDADCERLQGQRAYDDTEGRSHSERSTGLSDRAVRSFWSDADWLPCIDGKARPVEPGTFPLAHGATARVGRLRAYGNAIVPQAAAALIRAFLETRP